MRHIFVLCLLLALAGATAFGAPIRWTLNGVVFSDGGTATGDLTLDGLSLLAYNITVSGGDTAAFPTFRYANDTPHNISANHDPFESTYVFVFRTDVGAPGSGWPLRELRLAVADWAPAGTTIPLYLGGNYRYECYNCSPGRTVVAGSLTSVDDSVPEPATWMLAVPILGFVFRKRLLRAAGRAPQL